MAVKKYRTEADRAEARAAKEAMVRWGWTHRDLAAKTGLTRGTVSLIMGGFYDAWPAKAAVNAALGRDIFTKRTEGKQAAPTEAGKQKTTENKTQI